MNPRDLLRWPVLAGLVAVVAVAFAGAAVVYPRLTGDDTPAAGATTPAAAGVPTPTPPSTSDPGSAGADSGSAPSTPEDSTSAPATASSPPATATPAGPRIVSFTITRMVRCPSTKGGEITPLTLSWHAAGGVTKIAMSVDNPGIVGAYKTYDGPDGSDTYTNFSCTGPAGSKNTHVFTIYTVGGGKQVSRTLTISAVANDVDTPTAPPSDSPTP
jgi:hypothetical protein